MSDTPPPPPSSPPLQQPPSQYWCYHCEKRVSVETPTDSPSSQSDDVVCSDCKFGFVELITISNPNSNSIPSPPSLETNNNGGSGSGFFREDSSNDETTLGNQFIQVLRLLAQVAREEDAPPPPPPPPPPPRSLNPSDPSPADDNNDFLRIEIDGWDHDNEDGDEDNPDDEHDYEDDEEEDEDEDDVRSVEIEGDGEGDDVEEREEDARRRRRDVLRLRLRDFATRAARSEGRNRILDWAEILMGLEDNSIEFRFEMAGGGGGGGGGEGQYIGNPGDYVDGAEYEALLQTLAEAEGRRGAPPASKAAVEGLKVVEIKSEEESYVCAICKDGVSVGEKVKEMPCGHGYHGECIVPWLAARNSCPVCRFELETDDVEYEEERKKKKGGDSGGGASSGATSSMVV